MCVFNQLSPVCPIPQVVFKFLLIEIIFLHTLFYMFWGFICKQDLTQPRLPQTCCMAEADFNFLLFLPLPPTQYLDHTWSKWCFLNLSKHLYSGIQLISFSRQGIKQILYISISSLCWGVKEIKKANSRIINKKTLKT